MPSPVESVMAMFLMSLNNFGNIYEAFSRTEHEAVAKVAITQNLVIIPHLMEISEQVLFVIYMAIVAILLINMLIAMVSST